MARTTEITTHDADDRVADDRGPWLDSELLQQLIHDARADPSLLRELDALFPDTIADL
jgi:hypothetical protein